MKHSTLFKLLFVFIVPVIASFLFSADTFATDVYWGGSGSSNSGGGSGTNCNSLANWKSRSCYDCTTSGVANRRCPMWIETDRAGFQQAWDNRIGNYNYDAAKLCLEASSNTEGWVVYAGQVYNGTRILFNLNYNNSALGTWNIDYKTGFKPPRSGKTYDPGAYTYRYYGWAGARPREAIMNQVLSKYSPLAQEDLAFFCMASLRDPSTNVYGWSKIDGQEGGTITRFPGSVVTFTHGIYRETGDDTGSGNYYIESSGTLSGVRPTSGQTGINSGNIPYCCGTVGTNGSYTVTIPTTARAGDTLCQEIKFYTDKNKRGTGWLGANAGRVCVQVKDPPVIDNVCKELFPSVYNTTGYSWSSGRTVGRSVANNTSNGTDWRSATKDSYDTNTTVGTVLAKPEDTVRFRHTLCQGAQAVRSGANQDTIVAANSSCSISASPTVGTNSLFAVWGTSVNANPFNCSTTRGQATTRDFYDQSSTPGAVRRDQAGKVLTQNLTYSSRYASVSVGGSNPASTVDNGSFTTSAKIAVPYSYTLEPEIPTTVTVVYPEEPLEIPLRVTTETRDNPGTSDTPYSTRTKPSKFEVISFIVTPNSAKPRGYGDNDNTVSTAKTPGNQTETCGYYIDPVTLSYGTGCNIVAYGDRTFNDGGSLVGFTETIPSASINIGDMPVGTKYCVALSVWPYDSHNGAVSSTGDPATDPSLQDYPAEGGQWVHTPPKCFDIAKKPNVQIWGNSIFSRGAMTTSQSTKEVSSSLRTFGSWAEYAAISNRPIRGLGTGAAFGYEVNNNGPFANEVSLADGAFAPLWSALYGGLRDTTDPCAYSKATITNANCGNLGDANIPSTSIVESTISNIIRRYVTPGATLLSGTVSLNGLSGQYNVSDAAGITISASQIPKGKTISIYSVGPIRIVGDITYPEGPYDSASISDLSQVLLITDNNIYISDNVRYIDAWLVAGQTGNSAVLDRGVIDTCAGYAIPSLDASQCTNRLMINGPVIASRLITNRTAGAGSREDSILPGEIFNLRPDTYLWAAAQASQTQSATVTHIKTLPPRY